MTAVSVVLAFSCGSELACFQSRRSNFCGCLMYLKSDVSGILLYFVFDMLTGLPRVLFL